jgi:hypothetical protein
MTMRQFIRQHREQIDILIHKERTRHDKPGTVREFRALTDSERAEWIRNDFVLYDLARSEGVRNP